MFQGKIRPEGSPARIFQVCIPDKKSPRSSDKAARASGGGVFCFKEAKKKVKQNLIYVY
jgi:hypothetical protein